MTPSLNWRCLHVHVAAAACLDTLIAQTLPIIPGAETALAHSPWFFIRYGEAGPHLRFRIADAPQDAFDRVAAAWGHAVRHEHGIARADDGYGWPASGWEGGAHVPFAAPGAVFEAPYIPEPERYGGAHALAASENLFCISSRLAARLVALTGQDAQQRSLQAVDLMLAAAAALYTDPVPMQCFFEDYSRYWKALPSEAGPSARPVASAARFDAGMIMRRLLVLARGTNLQVGTATPAAHWLKVLRAGVHGLREIADCGHLALPARMDAAPTAGNSESSIARIVASHMHMMNNRLGIGPIVEMAWSDAIARALASR